MWTGLEMKVMKKGASATKIVDVTFLFNFTALFTRLTTRNMFCFPTRGVSSRGLV